MRKEGLSLGIIMDKEIKSMDGTELTEKLVSINRVAKVVRWKKIWFCCFSRCRRYKEELFGTGKAKEVPEAIKKATDKAKLKCSGFASKGRTIHHDIKGRHGASKVIFSCPPTTGIIAGGPMRAVWNLGVQDVVSKSVGSSSPYNMVRATFEGLQNINRQETLHQKGLKEAVFLERKK